jgi:antiviral helicase SKI2
MADEGVLDAILNPDPENTVALLDRLGLGGAPSEEEVHREIEEKLLLPKDRLPDHWLPSYQMCVHKYQ